MKFLKHCFFQALDRKWLIIVIVIELSAALSCFNLCFGEILLFAEKAQLAEENGLRELYDVGMTDSASQNAAAKEKLESLSNVEIYRFGIGSFSLDYNQVFVYYYPANALSEFNLNTGQGETIDPNKTYPATPCIVSSRLAAKYPVGQVSNIYDTTAGGGRIGDFYVCGTVTDDLFIDYMYAGFCVREYAMIVYDPSAVGKSGVTERLFVRPEDEEDFLLQMADFSVTSYSFSYDSNFNLAFRTITPYIVTSIAFFALGAAGLLSFSIVSVVNDRRKYGIFYICGATKGKILLTLYAEYLMILIPTLIITVILFLSFKMSGFTAVYLSWRSLLTSFGVCAALLLLSGVISVVSHMKRSPVEVFKGE